MMGALALLLVTAPLVAHHSFRAEFDRNAPIQLTGPVVRLEWVNPHSWIHLEITTLDGTKDVWMVEVGSPYVLQRRGLRRECLRIGMVLTVDGYQARDHSLTRANGRDVTFPDGRKFFLGSSAFGMADFDPPGAEAPQEPPLAGLCPG
jgi:hypothetical protein